MRVSFNQPYEKVRDTNGFGYAAKMCKESLAALGHDVSWRDATADVEINFIQPELWHWTGPYRIGYLPWESTDLRPGWVEALNECDEAWTPSPVIANWMEMQGVKHVHVYQHGVERAWSEIRRHRNATGTFQILHHGAEALRKGGNDTIAAFMDTLYDKDACLTMKMILQQFGLHDTDHIKIRHKREPFDQLLALYHDSDLLCYPSWGEGFGLAPLQAMAGGMPVLVTRGWAPYEYLLPEECLIDSSLVDSPWQAHHPGKMFQPDANDLREKLTYHFENRAEQADAAWDRVEQVVKDYDWMTLTREAFSHLA